MANRILPGRQTSARLALFAALALAAFVAARQLTVAPEPAPTTAAVAPPELPALGTAPPRRLPPGQPDPTVSSQAASIAPRAGGSGAWQAHRADPVDVPGDYWLTVESDVRHRRGCVYFGRTYGRPCEPATGAACKKCGG